MHSDIVIRGLNVSFSDGTNAVVEANAEFRSGMVTGLIGESGSGKSVLGMSILQLLPNTARLEGECLYGGRDLYRLNAAEMCKLRGREIALIPQNPSESLNPVRKIGHQLVESIAARDRPAGIERRDALLHRLGFDSPKRIADSYSFQLSGGMNQRVITALGLMRRPKWIIADEPTKGLDAMLRRQVYDVLHEIAARESDGMIVITHDIALAGALCNHLMVLYRGMIVEQGTPRQILSDAKHPYARGLIDSLPARGMHPIRRAFPERLAMDRGCRFYPRCEQAGEHCASSLPPETKLPDGRIVRCFLYAGSSEFE